MENTLTSGELLSATVDAITSSCPGCDKNVTVNRGVNGEDVFVQCPCGNVLFARWTRTGIHTTFAESLASAKRLIRAFFDKAEVLDESI